MGRRGAFSSLAAPAETAKNASSPTTKVVFDFFRDLLCEIVPAKIHLYSIIHFIGGIVYFFYNRFGCSEHSHRNWKFQKDPYFFDKKHFAFQHRKDDYLNVDFKWFHFVSF